jgi:hypothetical protein
MIGKWSIGSPINISRHALQMSIPLHKIMKSSFASAITRSNSVITLHICEQARMQAHECCCGTRLARPKYVGLFFCLQQGMTTSAMGCTGCEKDDGSKSCRMTSAEFQGGVCADASGTYQAAIQGSRLTSYIGVTTSTLCQVPYPATVKWT